MEGDCFAPVFAPQSWLVCLLLVISMPVIALAFMIAIIVGVIIGVFIPEVIDRIVCNYKKILFRISHCQKGNSDPGIRL
ncbi:MAG: hypothetical protein MJA83_10675 [Gammaproteobacteria bacterium]|nr:hypothetical protein [Gammaproteobacteria bacterium]